MQTLQEKIYNANPTLAKRGIKFDEYVRNPEILWNISEFVTPKGLLAQQLSVFRDSWKVVK